MMSIVEFKGGFEGSRLDFWGFDYVILLGSEG